MEVVRIAMNDWGTRFLKKDKEKGPWYVMTEEQAILKSSQIMRDYNRPDRVAQRESQPAGKIKRYRDSATPMDDVVFAQVPPEPLVENPFGVHDHDVLCGRGAYVNGNAGNQRLRELALQRKAQFDRGNFTEKRVLATEIVTIIRSLDPPGRFLQRARGAGDGKSTSTWEELSDERAIHKVRAILRFGSAYWDNRVRVKPTNYDCAVFILTLRWRARDRRVRLCGILTDKTGSTALCASNNAKRSEGCAESVKAGKAPQE
jgi:hypothetical protein